MTRRIILLAIIVAVTFALAVGPALAVTTPDEHSNCTGESSVYYAQGGFTGSPEYGRDDVAHDYKTSRERLGYNPQAYGSATNCNSADRIPPGQNP